MPTYVFKGRNTRDNSKIAGERTAHSKQALVSLLRREQIYTTSVREKGKEFRLPILRPAKVKDKEVAIFARQLSVMIDAGLPLVQALEAIAAHKENKVFKAVLVQVRNDVEGGMTLTDAMRKHPRVFSELFTSMISAGEMSGSLDILLQRISVFIEKIVKLKSAMKSAAIYPSVVMTVAIGVVALILWKVVPVFRTLFEGLGVELPLPTRIVIVASNFVSNYMIFLAAAAVLLGFGLSSYYKTSNGRHVIDRILLKLPILGEVFKKIATARFARTLSTLIVSGIAILEALEITARTTGNIIIQEAILKTRKAIEQGKSIAEPMVESRIFSPMVTQMIAIGEQTGELDSMLSKIADYFEDEVDVTMANLMTILEPVLIVFLGLVIGGIVISMYLPLFSLIAKLSRGA
ncbi:MAG: type II secretion system F family protein [Acidobacteria bacterium]|nr:type II secretion system F family protein [Acidobacteriota bacterium]MBI3656289.1 type II secretion system F family protein [Acidobacteriota bacterium]